MNAPSHEVAPARKRTRIQEKNEKKILDAAEEVIAEFGFHGSTIDRIAAKAEMSKPNLHYYFKTKEELYKAVLQRTLYIWIESLSRLDPDGDPLEQLSAYIVDKCEMSRRHPTASRVFANEILRGAPILKPYLRTELRELVREKSRTIRRWIDEGKLAEVDPAHLLFLIWAATQHYADFEAQVTAVLDTPKLSAKQFRGVEASLCQIILRGVLAPEGSSGR